MTVIKKNGVGSKKFFVAFIMRQRAGVSDFLVYKPSITDLSLALSVSVCLSLSVHNSLLTGVVQPF